MSVPRRGRGPLYPLVDDARATTAGSRCRPPRRPRSARGRRSAAAVGLTNVMIRSTVPLGSWASVHGRVAAQRAHEVPRRIGGTLSPFSPDSEAVQGDEQREQLAGCASLSAAEQRLRALAPGAARALEQLAPAGVEPTSTERRSAGRPALREARVFEQVDHRGRRARDDLEPRGEVADAHRRRPPGRARAGRAPDRTVRPNGASSLPCRGASAGTRARSARRAGRRRRRRRRRMDPGVARGASFFDGIAAVSELLRFTLIESHDTSSRDGPPAAAAGRLSLDARTCGALPPVAEHGPAAVHLVAEGGGPLDMRVREDDDVDLAPPLMKPSFAPTANMSPS